MIHTSRLFRFGGDAHNPVLTNPELIELMHNPCCGTENSGLVGTGSINLEFSVNSVFVKPPFVEHLEGELFYLYLFVYLAGTMHGSLAVPELAISYFHL